MTNKNNCDYHIPVQQRGGGSCANCHRWSGQRCKIEDKVKRNDKTELVHESFPMTGRRRSSRGVTMVLK